MTSLFPLLSPVQDFLGAAAGRFGAPRIVNIDVDEIWTIDEFIAFLYSTSCASKAILGELAIDFALDLRQRLAALIPPEGVVKPVEHSIIIAHHSQDGM